MTGCAKWMPVGIATVLHFLVDGLCLCCLYLMAAATPATDLLPLFLTYNILAFMTQPLTGWWTDRLSHPHKALLLSSCLLTAAVFMLMADTLWWGFTPFSTYAVAILLGMGNSMFHVWGGKLTAVLTGNDMRALGIFVSTGAMGLAFGALYASWWLMAGMLLCIALAASSLPLLLQRRGEAIARQSQRRGGGAIPPSGGVGGGFLLAILVFVMLRSFVGEVVPTGLERTSDVLLPLAIAAMIGKAGGGWIARWLGIGHAIVACVCVTAICMMWRGEDSTSLLPVILSVMAINFTMPMTLHLSNRLFPKREGLSFGLLAAVLIPGYMLAHHQQLSSMHYFMLSALLLTISVEIGMLLLMGEKRKGLLMGAVAINILTNVPLNYFLLTFGTSTGRIVGGELLVLLVEALWYFAFTRGWRKAAIYSLICNATSFLVGILIQLII